MAQADLHLHSSASDGLHPPREVLRRARGAGVRAVGLTDHDTVAGLAEAEREARTLGIDFVPGCEISIDFAGHDVHLLAYFVDREHPRLVALLERILDARRERVAVMVRRLNRLGIPLTMEEVAEQAARSNAVGRLHVARAMVAHGLAATVESAFRDWIGREGEAYMGKRTPEAAEVLEAVRAAGGVPVLGHPALYGIDRLEETFSGWDLAGVEAFHPSHSRRDEERLLAWAQRHDLAVTGGSDWHGDERPEAYIGSVGVDIEAVDGLRRRRRPTVSGSDRGGEP